MTCDSTCTPKTDSNKANSYDIPGKTPQKKTTTYMAAFVALCVACCAIPVGLVTFGLIGISTAAVLTTGLEVFLVVILLLGVGLFLRHYHRSKA